MSLSDRKFAALSQISLRLLCLAITVSPLAAKTPSPNVDGSYVPALAAANHFLQAWQSGDIESGMALLTTRAKEKAAADGLDKFFSSPVSAYEIGKGRFLKRGRYEFPTVLVNGGSRNGHPRRRFSSIVIVDTGNNDWAVDKLP
jgi:hypothetical protein